MNDIYTQQALPLYLQVAEDLKQAIESGVYPAASKLPSENQLVEQLKVSRVTVRKALGHLNDLGYTYAEKGKGTFVKPTKLKHDFLSMSGLAQEAAGMKTENKVVKFEVVTADSLVAEKLNIAEGELVNHGARLRYVNDAVVSFEEFYIPRVMLPELTEQDLQGSKFELLSEHGIEMVKTQQKLKPSLPSAEIKTLLEIQDDEPILINESQNYRDEERIYEYSVVYYKSSVYDFEITARL